MALIIKDPQIDQLARDLATTTGESITDAVRTALEDRLRRVRTTHVNIDRKTRALQEIMARGRARPNLDERSAAEILGYDDRGLPT